MFKAITKWDDAHERCAEIQVTSCSLVEVTKEGTPLRVHTLASLFKDTVLKRVNAPVQAPAACAPAAPAAMQVSVELDNYALEQLLAQLKAEATSSSNATNRTKLTSMEIHDRLLAMKIHD